MPVVYKDQPAVASESNVSKRVEAKCPVLDTRKMGGVKELDSCARQALWRLPTQPQPLCDPPRAPFPKPHLRHTLATREGCTSLNQARCAEVCACCLLWSSRTPQPLLPACIPIWHSRGTTPSMRVVRSSGLWAIRWIQASGREAVGSPGVLPHPRNPFVPLFACIMRAVHSSA